MKSASARKPHVQRLQHPSKDKNLIDQTETTMAFDWAAFGGNLLLFALVFGMSATVDIQGMRKQLRNVRAIITGIACQFIVLPILGFLVVNFIGLEPSLGIPLLVVTSSPGGSYSNWWCRYVR